MSRIGLAIDAFKLELKEHKVRYGVSIGAVAVVALAVFGAMALHQAGVVDLSQMTGLADDHLWMIAGGATALAVIVAIAAKILDDHRPHQDKAVTGEGLSQLASHARTARESETELQKQLRNSTAIHVDQNLNNQNFIENNPNYLPENLIGAYGEGPGAEHYAEESSESAPPKAKVPTALKPRNNKLAGWLTPKQPGGQGLVKNKNVLNKFSRAPAIKKEKQSKFGGAGLRNNILNKFNKKKNKNFVVKKRKMESKIVRNKSEKNNNNKRGSIENESLKTRFNFVRELRPNKEQKNNG